MSLWALARRDDVPAARSLYTPPRQPAWDLERCRRQLMVQYGRCRRPDAPTRSHRWRGDKQRRAELGVMNWLSSVAINVSTCVRPARPAPLQRVTGRRSRDLRFITVLNTATTARVVRASVRAVVDWDELWCVADTARGSLSVWLRRRPLGRINGDLQINYQLPHPMMFAFTAETRGSNVLW